MKTSKIGYNQLNDTPVSYLHAAIKKAIKEMQTCIPAIVNKVISREQVLVTPAVQQTTADMGTLSWASVVLPVYTPQGGNGIFSMPVSVGDTGWIIAGDLDPSLFFKDPSSPARQNVFDRHNYQYGFFLPCKMKNFGIDSGDDGGIVIKNGDTKIVVKNNEIDIVSSNTLKINASSANITASGNIKLESTGSGGKIEIKTNQNNKVEIDGLNFKSHCHISAAEGSPTSGAQAGT